MGEISQLSPSPMRRRSPTGGMRGSMPLRISLTSTSFRASRKNITASISSVLKRTPRTEEELAYDKQRTELLQGLGWRVIRFTNDEVFTDVDGVVEAIWEALKEAR